MNSVCVIMQRIVFDFTYVIAKRAFLTAVLYTKVNKLCSHTIFFRKYLLYIEIISIFAAVIRKL